MMEDRLQRTDTVNKTQLRFDWIGLVALIIGIDGTISVLARLPLDGGRMLILRLLICFVICIVFIRRYDWKNIAAALLLVCAWFHPIRFIFHWWLNPLLFGLATTICLVLLIRITQRYPWKNYVTAFLILCTLLSARHTVISVLEVGNCGIEDRRWTIAYRCSITNTGYQQIEALPVGMTGYCYYCPWYEGILIPW
jgi:hypothetical protein